MNQQGCGSNHVPVTPAHSLDQTLEEDDPASGQDGVSEKLETMMWMLVDFSRRVQDIDDKQKNVSSPKVSPYTSHADRRAIHHHPSSTHEPDLPEAIRQRVQTGFGNCRSSQHPPLMRIPLQMRNSRLHRASGPHADRDP